MSLSPAILPFIDNRTTLSGIRKNLPAFEPGLQQILRSCGLEGAILSATIGGSMPVFGVNTDLIVKLFPAFLHEFFANELASLRPATRSRSQPPAPLTSHIRPWTLVLGHLSFPRVRHRSSAHRHL